MDTGFASNIDTGGKQCACQRTGAASQDKARQGRTVLTAAGQSDRFQRVVVSDGKSVVNDGESVVVDGGSVVVDGKSVVSDGESVVSDGKSVVNDGESVVVDGKSVVNDGESVVVDGESVVNDGGSVVNDGGSVVVDGKSVVVDGKSVVNDGESVVNDGKSVVSDGHAVVNDAEPRVAPGCAPLLEQRTLIQRALTVTAPLKLAKVIARDVNGIAREAIVVARLGRARRESAARAATSK